MSYNLNIKFIGTGTISPDPNRSCTCIYLETNKENILVDIGCGTLHRLAEEKIDIHSINYIFITHFHPDHIGDLIPFLFSIRNTRSNSSKTKLRILGPRGLMSYIKGMEMSYGHWIQDSSMNIKFNELGRRLLDFPGFRVIWNKVIHKSESIGYRFEIGEFIISFSGDSGYCPGLIRICDKADIAILECSHADEHAVEGHLSPSLAGKIAKEAGAKKMILTHFYPDALKSDIEGIARKYFNGKVLLAQDGMGISIPENQEGNEK